MAEEEKSGQREKDERVETTEETPVESRHEFVVGGETIPCVATAGRMPLPNEKGEIDAQIFFVSYSKEGVEDPSTRPLVFVFNGGPGSSSIWLHLGACGPRRVKMLDGGFMPAPPYRLVPNEHSWLDVGDLVFIDPVGTGYSRAASEEIRKKHWSVKGDIEAIGEFIRLYLSRYRRWASPLYLAGESYGTMRAGGLAEHLVDHGIALNGIALISTVLHAGTLHFDLGNDLPYPLFLPSFAAAAHYHRRLPDDLLARSLDDVVGEVANWALTDYLVALAKGDRLDGEERDAVADHLVRYTGLSREHVSRRNLRIEIRRFCRELLREEGRTVGRLDSRFKGIGLSPTAEFPEFDPSMAAIAPPYTAMLNDHLRRELGYESDLVYESLNGKVAKEWEWEPGRYTDTSERLRAAFAENPFMKVLVAQGRYDLATPFTAIDYTLNHMDLDQSLRGNVRVSHYDAGHMLYIEEGCLGALKADIVRLLAESA